MWLLSMLCAFAFFVGVTRLELATSRPPDAYSNQLSYTPSSGKSVAKVGNFLKSAKFSRNFFAEIFTIIFIIK